MSDRFYTTLKVGGSNAEKAKQIAMAHQVGRTMLDVLAEMKTRYKEGLRTNHPWLGYTNWDKLVDEQLRYSDGKPIITPRQSRNILNGNPSGKSRKLLPTRQTVEDTKTENFTETFCVIGNYADYSQPRYLTRNDAYDGLVATRENFARSGHKFKTKNITKVEAVYTFSRADHKRIKQA